MELQLCAVKIDTNSISIVYKSFSKLDVTKDNNNNNNDLNMIIIITTLIQPRIFMIRTGRSIHLLIIEENLSNYNNY